MQIKVKKLHPDAILPQYATDGAACFDLHALDDAQVWPDVPSSIKTGLSFEIPAGNVMLIYSRSGHGFKNSVRLANCTGVIDSDYRGEVVVRLAADWGGRLVVNKGDRVAQAMIVPIPRVELVEVDELGDTVRGAGGFGSTGA